MVYSKTKYINRLKHALPKKQELSNRKYNLETRKEHTPKEHKAKKKIKLKLKSHFYNKIKSINS